MKINRPVAPEDFRKPRAVLQAVVFQDGKAFPICPQCHMTLEREYQAYCDRCGQCLDWRSFRWSDVISKR